MELSEVLELINEQDKTILDESGEVFFSSRNSFISNNKVMFIGLNPGGEGLPTIRENLERFWGNKNTESFSSYLDQCWHEPYFSNYKTCERCKIELERTGKIHPMIHQKRVSLIAEKLNIDLRQSISLNAIWSQTRTAADLAKQVRGNKRSSLSEIFESRYFPIIHKIISKHEIKLVICLGNGEEESPFSLFKTAYKIKESGVLTYEGHYLNGKYFSVKKSGVAEVHYFGIPHPSRLQLTELGMGKLMEIYGKII